MSDPSMFSRILVPVDGSEHAEKVLQRVGPILDHDEPEIFLLRAESQHLGFPGEKAGYLPKREEHLATRRKKAWEYVEALAERLRGEGRKEVVTEVLMGDPADLILREADRREVSLVAMATHGRSGPSRWVRGSVAERVLRHSNVPLLLCNPDREGEDLAAEPYKRILVAVDGSERSAQIMHLAAAMAHVYGASLLLVRVHELPLSETTVLLNAPEELKTIREWAEKEVSRLQEAGIDAVAHVPTGDPAAEVIEAASADDVDLVAMTTHGHSGLTRWLFGSVAEKVLRHSNKPLLVVRTK